MTLIKNWVMFKSYVMYWSIFALRKIFEPDFVYMLNI